MRKALSVLFLISFSSYLQAQVAVLDTLGELSKDLKEVSALVKTASGNIWALNDSGNQPILFQLSENGQIKKQVEIENAYNTDWEELAADESGNIYIGDFGNNRNNRTDLKVYIVSEKNLLGNERVTAAEIKFSYKDQTAFPPKKKTMNYDMEAMVYYNNALYLFTKNRTDPFTGYTYLYKLPTSPGEYTTERIDSLLLGAGPRELFQLTGADISPDGAVLALLSYDKYFLIHDFPYNDLFGGRIEKIETPLSQKESITFLNDSTLLLADERSVLGGGYIYENSIADLRKANSKVRKYEVNVPEKQFSDSLVVEVETEVRGKIFYEFYSGEGDRMSYGVVGEFDRGKHTLILTPKPFMNGTYLLNIQVGKRPHAFFVYRYSGVDWDFVEKEMEQQGNKD